ncbi:ISL3 family transposase [Kutzneria sp. CA-103260]|uniref:ISL3 family transposase n=1 Tax=Kutzneria sp. CA-103260 TaxID=2802641 RepID=UPI001BADBD8B|nr:ISL3 family transposase [Kutzneria sp. CA-103260]QUQ66307.1 ISL3 family transposase ISTesp2 [Kutzneria sp. CA-103260]QUQ71692.1 ISL3 family transposase ISTesp2 [Kutzneria sp. CA-103260]
MPSTRVWGRLLGLPTAVVETVAFDEHEQVFVASVRARRRDRGRCGICQRRCPGYDTGQGRRRWRALDLGTVRAVVEADAPRVACAEHGVVVAAVPWARHGAGHTRAFDDTVAWLATTCSKTTVRQLMRIAWPTVGSIITRVRADIDAEVDRLAGLRRIGIDEISYKKGHKYLTIVVDHDTGRLVWAAPGNDKQTLTQFFTLLGPARCAQITHVSADAAAWIARVVEQRCPTAIRCADPFHVVKWATDALDAVRRQAWNALRRSPGGSGRDRRGRAASAGAARGLKRARWALWKNPENLTDKQQVTLDWIAKADPRLYRAYLLKEGLRYVFAVGGQDGKHALTRWLSWAARCRIPEFVKLGRTIRTELAAIHASLDHGLSNALIESTNTKIRLLTRMAFGFKRPEALISLALLALGGYRPTLPGR